MKKLLFISLFIYLINLFSPIYSFDGHLQKQTLIVQCSSELKGAVEKIQKIPELRRLILSVQREGPIRIIVNNTRLSEFFGAYWNRDQRTICLAMTYGVTEGSIIGSIIFELHNALVDKKFEQLQRLVLSRKITKESYVREMEYLEYINSINAAKLAQIGIDKGIFPWDAKLPTYSNFEEHFTEQKRSGHSSCFEKIYDDLLSQ